MKKSARIVLLNLLVQFALGASAIAGAVPNELPLRRLLEAGESQPVYLVAGPQGLAFKEVTERFRTRFGEPGVICDTDANNRINSWAPNPESMEMPLPLVIKQDSRLRVTSSRRAGPYTLSISTDQGIQILCRFADLRMVYGLTVGDLRAAFDWRFWVYAQDE